MFNKSRVLLLLAAVFICASLVIRIQASANTLPNRSVTVSSGLPSAATTQTFRFDVPTTSAIGSLVFQYCSNSPLFELPCTPPPGLDTTNANLTSQTGNTGFSIDNADTTASKLVLTRTAAPGLLATSSYVLNNVINPSAVGTTYVRISTHAATDGSGPEEDTGGVAFAIQNAFNIGAFVPPFLQLCVGLTVAPDCSTTSGDSIDLGTLSSARPNYAQSQFAVATNDLSGYTVYALGTTMTSGNNTVAALNSPTASFPGTPQFGINLRSNLIPPVGQNPVGVGTGTPTANYNQPNRFTFIPGDAIASSNLTTNYNRMTVSYLVNVPSKQPAGVYATTITYTAVVSF
jgi:hypothetical protein